MKKIPPKEQTENKNSKKKKKKKHIIHAKIIQFLSTKLSPYGAVLISPTVNQLRSQIDSVCL